MDSIFFDPSSLPGGRMWAAACSEAVESGAASAVLKCDTSPIIGFCQVLILLLVYGSILFKSSQLIADGSELLLLVPSLRHIVGSVVLPILGAVPDGAIVLFSGLGPNAQEELSVGVGALAGSTSMLLTLPWFLSILAGRVNIRQDGILTYHHRPYKLNPPNNMDPSSTGVEAMPMVAISGRIMLLTALSYVVIQGAALMSGTLFQRSHTTDLIESAAKLEHWPALICLITSTSFFAWYLFYQVTSTSDEEKSYFETYVDAIKRKKISGGQVSLTAAFHEIWSAAADADETTGLIVEDTKKERLHAILKTFFMAYDKNYDKRVDKLELGNLMRDMGEVVSSEELNDMFVNLDADSDGSIELWEFVEYMPTYMMKRARARGITPGNKADELVENEVQEAEDDEEGGEQADENGERGFDEEETQSEEEEDVPEDLRNDDPETQIRNVIYRSFFMMACGTILVLIFSDPMVGVLSDIGARIGVPAFYVSFVLAPLASNASELLAAYSYAQKKTRKSVTISFSTLLGAAIMNNTFVLAIFMLLITAKGLAWTFTAETISILFVEIVMAFVSQKRVLTLRDGYMVFALYPMALLIVAFLENVVGLD